MQQSRGDTGRKVWWRSTSLAVQQRPVQVQFQNARVTVSDAAWFVSFPTVRSGSEDHSDIQRCQSQGSPQFSSRKSGEL